MLQKIRKNKFLKKTLVFSSVFLILTMSIVLPCFAQAPAIDNIKNSSSTYLYSMYFNDVEDTTCDVVFYVILCEGANGNDVYYPMFTESFLTTYGFNYYDNPTDVYNLIYNNQEDYICYSNYSTYTVYEALHYDGIDNANDFTSAWNNTFGFAKNLYDSNLNLQNGIEQLNAQITQKDREINNLNGQYNDLNIAYNDLQSNYNTLNQNYNNLQSSNNTLQSDYNTLNQNYNDLQVEYDNLYLGFESIREAYLVANSKGYTQALNDMNAFRKGLFDIFNAPFEFVRNLTGAEIFGINIFGIFCFFFVFVLGLFLFSILRGLIF